MKTNTNHASVLLVMDIQRKTIGFLPDPIPLLRNIGKAIAAARKANIPVIYVTAVFGFSLLFFGESFFKIDDVAGVIEIMIPVFFSQVVSVVKWFSSNNNLNEEVNIPRVIIFLPPIVVLILLILTFSLKVIGFNNNASYTPDDARIKEVVTFCMTMLSGTTIYLVTVYYGKSSE
jgi:hypothetical protein